MVTEPTEVDKIRRLPWLIAGDVLNSIFYQFTIAGSVFLLFLSTLGLDNAQIGFLLSLVPFFGIISLLVAPGIARFGYKRAYLVFFGLRKLSIGLLVLTPLVQAHWGTQSAFAWVALTIGGFALFRAIGMTGLNPWQKEAVPDSIRGKFTALSNIISRIGIIIVTIVASYVIGSGTGLNRFLVLIAVGVVLGALSVWSYAHVPGGSPGKKDGTESGYFKGMKQAIKDKDFLLFLSALGLATIGSTAVISFVPLFMKEQVGLNEGTVVLLNMGIYAGGLVSSYLWGWASDRYGSKPIMQTSLYMMLFLPVAWFLMPRHNSLSAAIAMAIAFVAGVSTLAWQIGWLRYLFVNAIPSENNSPYMAVYNTWYGIASGIAPLMAGQILYLFRNVNSHVWVFSLDAYTPLFAISLALVSAGIITTSRLRKGGTRTVGRFAGMFVQGNPIRALESLIRYHRSRTEMSRLVTTERFGDAQNPFSVNELIEALNDPSANVRYEAIHSIGRMPPEPELVDALIEILDGPESELSGVAARSLGRLGDKRAIEPLRKALNSKYHLIEANSVRALSALEDIDSIPFMLERFRQAPSHALKLAYVSAMGKLRVEQAMPEIFSMLRETRSRVLRGEIGLALARIIGAEDYYMQQWRALHANKGTAAAQALLGLQRRAEDLGLDEFVQQAETCVQQFARDEMPQAVDSLAELTHVLPRSLLGRTVIDALDECAASLAEFGHQRLEFILLTLHTLDNALQEIHTLQKLDGNGYHT